MTQLTPDGVEVCSQCSSQAMFTRQVTDDNYLLGGDYNFKLQGVLECLSRCPA